MKEQLKLPGDCDGAVWLCGRIATAMSAHRHDELESNLVLAGSGVYLVDDQRFTLSPRTLIWLFPAQEHVLVDVSSDFRMWIGVFRPSAVKRWCRHDKQHPLTRRHAPANFCKQLPMTIARQLDALHQHTHHLERQPDRFNAALSHLMFESWATHEAAGDWEAGTHVHPAVDKAALLIRDHQQAISIDQIAEQCDLSPSRLSRLFKQQTGVALVHYRQRVCLERFFQLHEAAPYQPLAELCLAAGFGSYAQFHRVFKQLVGHAPQDYMRDQAR